ncbi:MAG: hypothetical protein WCF94_01710 [bacterium]
MNLWIFDNDGTLYNDDGIKNNFPDIFSDYVSGIINKRRGELINELPKLKIKWGTNLSALAISREYDIDFNKIVKNTYLKIHLKKRKVKSNKGLRAFLKTIESDDKIVFTNSPSKFAKAILKHNNVSGYFKKVFGIQENNFLEKPDVTSYDNVKKYSEKYDKIFFCDNSIENLNIPSKLGWITILYKNDDIKHDKNVLKKHIVVHSFNELSGLI